MKRILALVLVVMIMVIPVLATIDQKSDSKWGQGCKK